jgi:hypothetical protein
MGQRTQDKDYEEGFDDGYEGRERQAFSGKFDRPGNPHKHYCDGWNDGWILRRTEYASDVGWEHTLMQPHKCL